MALNNVDIMGRLVVDPEIHTTNSDKKVASFRIAVDRDYKNKETGERDSDFFNVSIWAGGADFVMQYFAKGDQIIINGRLQARQYQDKDGNNRTATEIVANNVYFCGGKKNSSSGDVEGSEGAAGNHSALSDDELSDGDLPF